MSRMESLRRMLAAPGGEGDPDLLYMLAQEHAKAGETREAVEWYDRCLAASPEHCYAYYHKARALEESGDVEAAIETLRAGARSARETGDAKAAGEIATYLDTLGG